MEVADEEAMEHVTFLVFCERTILEFNTLPINPTSETIFSFHFLLTFYIKFILKLYFLVTLISS